MSINGAIPRLITLVGYLQCTAGVWIVLLGLASSLRGLKEAESHGDSTGVGTLLSTMGLTGSIFIGGLLFFAGLGLLKRSQLARRIQVVLAALVALETISALFSSEGGLLGKGVPVVAISFLILMFLPSVREQFAGPQ